MPRFWNCSPKMRACSAGCSWPKRKSASRACPRAFAGSDWGSATSPASPSTRWWGGGGGRRHGRGGGGGRARRAGGEPQPRDRRHARRERCGLGLAFAQPDAEYLLWGDLGLVSPRRRCRHGLFTARRHGDRVRRHRSGGTAHRARAVERSGERRHAPRGRRLPGRDRLRARPGPRSAVPGLMRLGSKNPTLRELRSIARDAPPLELDPAARDKVRAALATVEAIVASGKPAYGINTGFGRLSQTRIPAEELEQLQLNIVLSHAAGTGPLLDDATVRLILSLKVISLAAGHSGVRPELIELLLQLYNRGIHPCIPAKGSVGASGDLAPLAHLSLALLGIGHVRVRGVRIPAASALKNENLKAIKLAPKEGLALLNGTQVSTALALTGLFAAEDVFAAALAAGSLSVAAAAGDRKGP